MRGVNDAVLEHLPIVVLGKLSDRIVGQDLPATPNYAGLESGCAR